jgi:predicted Zn-dependent protease
MNSPKLTVRYLLTGSLVATVMVVVLTPFNMGGCSATNIVENVQRYAPAAKKATESLVLDERSERAMGQSVSLALTNRYGVVKSDDLAQYVILVGKAVASATPRADSGWVIGVLDTNDVNAFSGPQGYVWVTRGALMHMQDESELAGVLGHEMGHIVKRHGFQAVQGAGLIGAGQMALQANDQTAQFNQITDFFVDLVTKTGFTQPQEFEADAEGVRYAAAAGYDPNGYLHFLQRIQAEQGKGGVNLFSTHPGLGDRIQRIANQISSGGIGGHGVTNQERFQQAIKGQKSVAG